MYYDCKNCFFFFFFIIIIIILFLFFFFFLFLYLCQRPTNVIAQIEFPLYKRHIEGCIQWFGNIVRMRLSWRGIMFLKYIFTFLFSRICWLCNYARYDYVYCTFHFSSVHKTITIYFHWIVELTNAMCDYIKFFSKRNFNVHIPGFIHIK